MMVNRLTGGGVLEGICSTKLPVLWNWLLEASRLLLHRFSRDRAKDWQWV
jgi:hypothetical protein